MVRTKDQNGIHLSNFDKIPHPYDAHGSVNNGFEGAKFFKPIMALLKKQNILLPKEPKLLGLGAGIANPECALADKFKIPYHNVTLVDKNPEVNKGKIFSRKKRDISFLKSMGAKPRWPVNYISGKGIFDYLINPDQNNFSIVTLIGLEYFLDDPNIMEAIIRKLPNILLNNGFVCVYPEVRDMKDEVWTECGFEEVILNDPFNLSGARLYIYTNKR